MKIAHLSDLHISSKFKRNNIAKTKKIIKQAINSGADHFVITGDLTDNADEKDYLILRKILETYKLLSWDKTSVVIGNHDIFGGVQTAQDVISFPSKCAKTDYKKKVSIFLKYFSELFENAYSPIEGNPFPFAKEIGNVVLIGINSIDKYSKIKNPFASNGRISKEQKKGLSEIFDIYNLIDKTKIALIHHHFYKNNIPSKSSENSFWNSIENFTMKLRGKKKIIKLFNDNRIKMVLHGHSHEMVKYKRKGITFLNAGGSIDNENQNTAELFLIESNTLEVKILKYGMTINNPVTSFAPSELVLSI